MTKRASWSIPPEFIDAANAKAAKLGLSTSRYITKLIGDDQTKAIQRKLPEPRNPGRQPKRKADK